MSDRLAPHDEVGRRRGDLFFALVWINVMWTLNSLAGSVLLAHEALSLALLVASVMAGIGAAAVALMRKERGK